MSTNSHTKKPKGIGRIMNRSAHKNKTPNTPGYRLVDGKVYYRTKKGKTGNMPSGHEGMIKRWGLKKKK